MVSLAFLVCLACAIEFTSAQHFDNDLYGINDDSLLPEELPSSGHPDQSAPVLLEVPKPAYVTRSQPATLTCRSAHALHLYFRCAGQLVTSQEHSRADYVDPQTAIRQLEVKLDVDWRTVEEYFGEYSCVCVAWSSRGEKTSPSVQISAAYLKRQFPTAPSSQTVEVDQTVELRCSPPEGDPKPNVSWTKNNVLIDPKLDPNIIREAGNLLIAEVKLSDMANYSCVAENVANKRISKPARLTVYVNGGWSEWGVWSSCQPMCGAGHRRRHRSCNNPSPMNGGRPCRGPALQTTACNSVCPGGRRLTRYGAWTACDVTCRQSRQRTCTAPAPAHGGRRCSGPDREHRNCSRTDCHEAQNALHSGEATANPAARAVGPSDVTLYVSLALALLVFPMVALLALKLYRRKGRRQSAYGLTDRDFDAKYYDNGKKQLSYTPDLTSGGNSANSTPPSRADDFAYNIFRGPNRTSVVSENHYAEPLLPLPRAGGSLSFGGHSSTASRAPAGTHGSQRSHSSQRSKGSSSSRENPHSSASSYCSSHSSDSSRRKRQHPPAPAVAPAYRAPQPNRYPHQAEYHSSRPCH